jgi:uncharacterized membrane protein YhaH (DUF805 family)
MAGLLTRTDLSLLTSFEGRISRAKWWLGLLVILGLQAIVAVIVIMVSLVTLDLHDPAQLVRSIPVIALPVGILALLLLYPILAVYTKRWHDRGKSGWWTLIGLVPLIGGAWLLIELGFVEGIRGPNQYGPDPLEQ